MDEKLYVSPQLYGDKMGPRLIKKRGGLEKVEAKSLTNGGL
jgi:hypothetical protein